MYVGTWADWGYGIWNMDGEQLVGSSIAAANLYMYILRCGFVLFNFNAKIDDGTPAGAVPAPDRIFYLRSFREKW